MTQGTPDLAARGYMSVADWEAFRAGVRAAITEQVRRERTRAIVEVTPILSPGCVAIRRDALARMTAALT
jgi:hypothetical protein